MNVKSELEVLLRTVMQAEGAEMAGIQKYDRLKDELSYVVQFGLPTAFIAHFEKVKPFDPSCCGRAFGIGSTVILGDVNLDIAFRPNLEAARIAGFRAVKSVPIYNSAAEKIGVLSTHFKEPKFSWSTEAVQRILPRLAELLDQEYSPRDLVQK